MKYVWHGSYSNGARMTDSYCEEWRTRDHEASGQASPLVKHKLLGQELQLCSEALAVLCVQISPQK